MSVYIKDMEMPTHCIDCPFMISRDNDDCILQSAEANENFKNWEQMKAGCPLVTISPHGRLIDANVLDVISYCDIPQGHEDTFDDGVMWLAEQIDLLPTIIPAEEDE